MPERRIIISCPTALFTFSTPFVASGRFLEGRIGNIKRINRRKAEMDRGPTVTLYKAMLYDYDAFHKEWMKTSKAKGTTK